MDIYNNKKPDKEFYVQWHFIDSCNLRCKHCYQNGYSNKNIDFDILNAIFKKLDAAMAKWNMKCYVSLTGGEPFLKINFAYLNATYCIVAIIASNFF